VVASDPLVPVGSCRDPFEAQVVLARLGAEGIVAEARNVSSTYPLGQPVMLWVEAGHAEEAAALLRGEGLGTSNEEETALGDPLGDELSELSEPDGAGLGRRWRPVVWSGLAIALCLALAIVVRAVGG